jgi:hypothetical protein
VKRKPFERAIIYAGVLGGLSRDELNVLLQDGSPGAARVPESSYRSMRSTYFPHWTAAIGDKASVSQNALSHGASYRLTRHPAPMPAARTLLAILTTILPRLEKHDYLARQRFSARGQGTGPTVIGASGCGSGAGLSG